MGRLGHFEIGELLGEGGMSVVWAGQHVVLGTPVAIKVLKPEYAGQPTHRAAFFAEARAHAKLAHPGILRILDVGEVDAKGAAALPGMRTGAPFIAMERATGSLEDDLPMPNWAATFAVLREMLDALAYAHARGVVHRDLKPGNMLRVERSEGPTYRLSDFGLAHGRGPKAEAQITMGPTAGTPMYMAPEQINGLWRDFGPPTDLYALGCVAYRLVCGRPPFVGETLFQVVAAHAADAPEAIEPLFAVPDGLQEWIFRLLAKLPHQRFQRAADAAAALVELSEGFVDPAHPGEVADLGTWGGAADTLEDLIHDAATGPEIRARAHVPGDGLGLFDLVDGPLIGRVAESQRLREALREARQRRGPSVVILRGPAGVGVTQLARAFATRMDELGLAFVHEASHTLVEAAHEGLAGLLDSHFSTWGLTRAEVDRRVRAQLARFPAPLADEVAAAVVEVIARSRDGEHLPMGAFRTSREETALLDAALRAGHDDRPRLFLFDDVQWGRESLEFVRDRVDAEADAVFVLTVRDDALTSTYAEAILEDLAARPETVTIELEPPTTEDVRRFVASLLDFAPSAIDAITRAAGNDFNFARHLVGHLRDANGLVLHPEGFVVASSVPLPSDWEVLWTVRLANALQSCGLDDDALFGLEVAAELGRHPEGGELVDALEIAGVTVSPSLLDALARRGLAAVEHGNWAFALQSLVAHLRARSRQSGRVARWSAACATAIERRPRSRDRASRVAWHRLQGDDLGAAFPPLRYAIRAEVGVDPERAEMLLGWWDDTCEALGLAAEAAERIESLLLRASLAQTRGQTGRVHNYVERALRASRTVGYTVGEAWALLRIGQSAMDDGELDFALDRFRRAEAMFRRVGEHEGRAGAMFGAGLATMRLGALVPAEGDFRAAIEIYETLGNSERALAVMSHLAYAYVIAGDFDAAERLARRACDDARRLGDHTLQYESLQTLGDVARLRGAFDDAEGYLNEVATWRRTLGLRDVVLTEYSLALVALGRSRWAVARRMLEECESRFIARGLDGRLPLVLVAWAVAALGDGDDAAFAHLWQRAAPTLDDPSFVHVDAVWCAELGAALARGRGLADVAAELDAAAAIQRARLANPLGVE